MIHEVDFACDLSVVAWKTYQNGNIDRAKALYRRALRIFQRCGQKSVPEMAAVLNRLGIILERNREYRNAARCYQRACVLLEGVEGDKRITRLKVRSLYHYGRIRRMQGCQKEAELLLKQAMDLAAEKLGQKDVEYAYAVNQLAMLYRHTQQTKQARGLYYRALAVLEAKLGSEHPRVASVYRNLSELEYAAGRAAKGEPFARRAILIRMKLLGPDHPDLAPDLATLGCLLKAQGRFKEAEYVDNLMQKLVNEKPKNRSRQRDEPLSQLSMTLEQYYRLKRKRYSLEYPSFYDRDLRRIFSDDPRFLSKPSASNFLRRNRSEIRRIVSRGTDVHPYTIDHVLDNIIVRAKDLKLRVEASEKFTKQESIIMLTVHTMNIVHSGRYRFHYGM